MFVLAILALLAGTAGPQAVTLAEWAAIQTSNALLLDQGPVRVYLPIVLWR